MGEGEERDDESEARMIGLALLAGVVLALVLGALALVAVALGGVAAAWEWLTGRRA